MQANAHCVLTIPTVKAGLVWFVAGSMTNAVIFPGTVKFMLDGDITMTGGLDDRAFSIIPMLGKVWYSYRLNNSR